ncbi:MAG: FAD:protein FMN transferase [Candidatus Eisenbacteria bacterium]|uniref:FAD:protein FMN transferase n=1 Tax=Eiseniibacteriota bacterium TaxID=2212470 RepID=A0A956NAM7_UNCEI|nr:FAD:protein FMN transferase [Candidatus Eisenbacteria bacterium]MCB9464737.1 FAD:protein FMN transferase [Candidatus Eisenbacteria bacterium]
MTGFAPDRRRFLRLLGKAGLWGLAAGAAPSLASFASTRPGSASPASRLDGDDFGLSSQAMDPAVRRVVRSFASMGTLFEVEIQGLARDDAIAAIATVRTDLRDMEEALTVFRPGADLVRLAETPEGRWIDASPILVRALFDARAAVVRTRGAFDPTVAPMMKSWGLHGPRLLQPSPRIWRDWLRRPGWDAIDIDAGSNRVRRLDRRIEIDLGGIGKGIALDAVAERLRSMGVESGILNFGGSICVVGPPVLEDAWPVGIAHPREDGALWMTVDLVSGCLTTSADSERFHLDGSGKRIHHILDPRTGLPVRGVASVTSWSVRGVDGDVDSTAAFVESGPLVAGEADGSDRDANERGWRKADAELRILSAGRGLHSETAGRWSRRLG